MPFVFLFLVALKRCCACGVRATRRGALPSCLFFFFNFTIISPSFYFCWDIFFFLSHSLSVSRPMSEETLNNVLSGRPRSLASLSFLKWTKTKLSPYNIIALEPKLSLSQTIARNTPFIFGMFQQRLVCLLRGKICEWYEWMKVKAQIFLPCKTEIWWWEMFLLDLWIGPVITWFACQWMVVEVRKE